MTATEELRYSTDRDHLLARAALHHGRGFEVPAEALEDVLEMLGYRLEQSAAVPANQMTVLNYETQQVLIADNLAERLAFPASAPGVLRSSLAVELGHIRLHVDQMRKGIKRKCWENRAFQYGMVFLMPREAVLARPQVRILQRGWAQEQEEIWNLVADLGREFHVNGSYMCRALVAYGVVKMNRKTRVIKPCLLTSETAESAVA